MPKEDTGVDTGVDVQIISGGAAGGAVNLPAAAQSGNGVVVIPQVGALPQSAQPGPTVIVITVGKKDEEKKKKSSSVFQRL